MMYEIFSIYDKVAATYSSPSIFLSKEIAIRDLKFVVNSDKKMSSMASDLTFYRIGDFDVKTGKITYFPEHDFICNVSDLIEKE